MEKVFVENNGIKTLVGYKYLGFFIKRHCIGYGKNGEKFGFCIFNSVEEGIDSDCKGYDFTTLNNCKRSCEISHKKV